MSRRMRYSLRRLRAGLILAGLVALIGCGSDIGGVVVPPPPPPGPPPPPPPPAPLVPIAQQQRITLQHRPFGVAVSPEGVVLVTRLDAGVVSRIDLTEAGGTLAGTIAVGAVPTDVEFGLTTSRAFVTNQFSGTVGVLDIPSMQQTSVIPMGFDPYRVHPIDGTRIAVTGNAGRVSVAEFASGTILRAIDGWLAPNGVASDAATARLYVGDPYFGVVTEVDLTTGATIRTLETEGAVQDVAFVDGEIWFTMEGVGVGVWPLNASGFTVLTLGSQGGFGLAVRADGRAIAVAGSNRVFYLDRENRSVINEVATGGIPRRIAFTADDRVIVANEAGWVDILK